MARKVLFVISSPAVDGKFITYFQGQILLLLKRRDYLTQTQVTRALRLLGEKRQ